jgi:hypothetical protein
MIFTPKASLGATFVIETEGLLIASIPADLIISEYKYYNDYL